MPVEHYFDFSGDGFNDPLALLEPIGPDGLTTSYGNHGFLVDPLGGIDDPSDATSIRPPIIPEGPPPANPLEHLINSPHVQLAPHPEAGGEVNSEMAYLFFDYNGQRYAVGAPTTTGTVESITLADDTTMNILSDTNGDGRVDYLSSVCFQGGWSAWSAVEDEEAGGVEEKTSDSEQPPATPDGGQQEWKTETWKCVERGDWG